MHRDKWLRLLCFAEIGTMLVLLNYSAALPIIKEEWGLTNTRAGLIYSSYQGGYILLVVLLSTLTDYVDTKKIYVASALWAGVSGILFSLFANSFLSALILRSLTGFGLAGTYMPGLKMVSASFPSEERGKAVGLYVGTFSLGTALSLFLTGLLMGYFHWRTALFITSLGPIIGGLLAIKTLNNMPPVQVELQGERDVRRQVFTNRPALLVMVGYMAHMWEMFGMRGWIVAFFAAALVSRSSGVAAAASYGAQISALIILAGAFSTVWAGRLSDRYGRVRTIQVIMLAGAFCSFIFGWLRPLPVAVLILFSLIYGFFVTAESSVLSTAVTEEVPFPCLGSAMALQSFLGWTAAAVSPIIFGIVLDWTNPAHVVEAAGFTPNWGPAFVVLGLGALLGPVAMVGLQRLKKREEQIRECF
ncbi:MAG: MFS transporter [Clostridiales bacterium]|jgi:MFS family permease|nr:MFS transporter [Clostridiales bacterium]